MGGTHNNIHGRFDEMGGRRVATQTHTLSRTRQPPLVSSEKSSTISQIAQRLFSVTTQKPLGLEQDQTDQTDQTGIRNIFDEQKQVFMFRLLLLSHEATYVP